MDRQRMFGTLRRAWSLACLLGFVVAAQAGAQTSTGSIRGVITDAAGAPIVGANVVATDPTTNYQRGALTEQNGFFNISGLPPGTYEFEVSSLSYAAQTRTVRVLVGQTLNLDIQLSVEAIALEGITATATAAVEMKTPELATNVTREQIESTPLNDRNFLSLAMFAPGMRRDGGSITSGAQSANNINVFIDGASYKNDILVGGVVGQDASKGNPFPQVAIQEFRVITQQYKAEYQKATSAIITATTKSGTNEWHGGLFAFRQTDGLIERDYFAQKACDEDPAGCAAAPELGKWQVGGSVGGPIIEDKLFFFGSYEGNHQDRSFTTTIQDPTAGPPGLVQELEQYEGISGSPFRSNLYFGKLTYTPAPEHRFELSANIRDEYDIRSFGGRNSYQNAEEFNNDVNTFLLKHQYAKTRLLNEAMISYQTYEWHPIPLFDELVGLNYDRLLKIGGRSTMQDMTQSRLALRNDVSYTVPGWAGDHVFKTGVTLDFLDYDVIQPLNGNPEFFYKATNDYAFPVEARAGFGNPDMSRSNVQFGAYLQDDWSINDRLTLNLGVRWDYESNMNNNDYVTPDAVRQAVLDFVATLPCDGSDPKREQLCDASRYMTDGDDRPAFLGAVQPRVGFSYDLFGDDRTVVFGGFGVYYDRNRLGNVLSELSKLQWRTYTFRFSADGQPVNGNPTIQWEDEYLSREGLQSILSTGSAPKPELFLVENSTEPPMSRQFSFGVRRTLGDFLLSANYTGVRGYNTYTWIRANRRADGSCCNQLPEYSNVFVSSDDARNWYDALYFKAEKRYTEGSRWGAQIAYTLGWAEEEARPGGVFSALGVYTVDDFNRYPSNEDERHRVIANWLVGLPYDVMFSGILELGSGRPFNAFLNFGPGANNCTHGNRDCVNNEYPEGMGRNAGEPERHSFIIPNAWAFRNVDLRLEKSLPTFQGHDVSLVAEVFNVFDYANFNGFEGRYGNIQADGSIELNEEDGVSLFGRPTGVVTDGSGAPRRFQLGMRYSF